MVRVAAVQMQPALLDVQQNLARVVDWTRQAAAQGARLVVFPELALCGYAISADEARAAAQPIPGPATEVLAGACTKTDTSVVIGLLERDPEGTLFNASVLIGPRGLQAVYRKTHLPLLGVDRYLAAGDAFVHPVDTPAGRLGLLICYDLRFPEPIRVHALHGAQIIALSTAWPAAATLYPEFMARCRAAENRVTLIAANRVGQERGTRYLGRSLIVSPEGELLAEAPPDQEYLLLAEIDPERSDVKRLVFTPGEYELDLFGDRRPELYRAITDELGPAG
jgi:predicted amidohydrolase